MSIAATVKAMAAAGFTAQQIDDVVSRMDEQRRAKTRAGNARRQAEFRARHNESNANNGVTHVTDVTSITEPETLARPREEVLTSLNSKISSKENPPKGGQKKGSPPSADTHPRKNKSQIAEDAKPSEKDRAFAEREGMWPATIDHQWGLFLSKNLASGNTYLNWYQAWVTWVKHWVGYGRKQIGSPPLRLAETGDKRVFVIRGSPQWTAWTAYLGKPKPTTQRGSDEGWYFESEWPPDATVTSPFQISGDNPARTETRNASEREGPRLQACGAG